MERAIATRLCLIAMRRTLLVAVTLLAGMPTAQPLMTRIFASVKVPAFVPNALLAAQTVSHANPPSKHPITLHATDSPLHAHFPTASPVDSVTVNALISVAVQRNPRIEAERQRVQAAKARQGPSGLPTDPRLMLGLRNVPVSEPGFRDFMTMKMVGVSQTIPYPGKLRVERDIAAHDVELAAARERLAVADVTRDIQEAFYDLVYVDRAMEIVTRNRDVLVGVTQIVETRYAAGSTEQQEVLRSRLALTRLADQATVLVEQRHALVAQLNALLDQPSETVIEHAVIAERVARATVRDSTGATQFLSASLGARVANSPFPSLRDAQLMALRESPDLREMEAQIVTQTLRVERARKEHLPDIDVMLEYGQRNGLSDMVSATVSIPLGVRKQRKQDQLAMAAAGELSALQADRLARQNVLRADVARLLSDLERQRAQLALYQISVYPLARASLQSALADFQAGRVALTAYLEQQVLLFNHDLEYARLRSDVGKSLALLERVVGVEVLP